MFLWLRVADVISVALVVAVLAMGAPNAPLHDYPSDVLYPDTDAFSQFASYFTRVVDGNEVDDDTNPSWASDSWVYSEFDILFDKFSELRVQTYLQLLSDATGFPVSQIQPINDVTGKRGVAYGMSTLFSVKLVGARPRRVFVATTTSTASTTPDPNATTPTTAATTAPPRTFAPPPGFTTTTTATTATTPTTTDPASVVFLPSDASNFVNAVRAALRNARSDLTQETAFSIRRVYPTYRKYETAEMGVNYYWVAFIILSVIMVSLSIFFVFHYRTTTEAPKMLDDAEEDKERSLADKEMVEFDDAAARRVELDGKMRKGRAARLKKAINGERPMPLSYEDVRGKEWEAYLEEEARNTLLYGEENHNEEASDSRAIREAFNDKAFTSVSRAAKEAKQEIAAHPYIYGGTIMDEDGLLGGESAEDARQNEARRKAEALVEEEDRQRIDKLPFVQTIQHDRSFALPLADEEAKIKQQQKKRAALIKAAKAAAAQRAGRAATEDAEQELDEEGRRALADVSDPEDGDDAKVAKRIRRERRRREEAERIGYQGYVQMSRNELFDLAKAETIFQYDVQRGGFKKPLTRRLVDIGILHYDPVLDTYETIPEEERNNPFATVSTYVPPSVESLMPDVPALREAPSNLEEYSPRRFGQPAAAAANSSPELMLYSDPDDSSPLDLPRRVHNRLEDRKSVV